MESRAVNQLREWRIEPAPFGAAPGRVIVCAGRTTVLCTASVELNVPPWLVDVSEILDNNAIDKAMAEVMKTVGYGSSDYGKSLVVRRPAGL